MCSIGCDVMNSLSGIYVLEYVEAAVNGKLSSIFLFPDTILDKYITLWYESKFLTVFLSLWD